GSAGRAVAGLGVLTAGGGPRFGSRRAGSPATSGGRAWVREAPSGHSAADTPDPATGGPPAEGFAGAGAVWPAVAAGATPGPAGGADGPASAGGPGGAPAATASGPGAAFDDR